MTHIPTTQKAIRIHKTGGPEVLQYEDVPVPEVGDNQLLVKNAYAGVNFIDSYFRQGIYPATLPITLGREGAGEVVKVGANVDKFAVGDTVGFLSLTGAYCEYSAVDVNTAVRIPHGVDVKTVGAGILQALTALTMTSEAYPVKRGDYVLVWAAAGGTGALLTQFAKYFGAIVIGITSSEEKAEVARQAGATYVINYKAQDEKERDVVARVKELTDGKGVAAIFDGVGKDSWETSKACIARKGTIVSFGNASGVVPPVSLLTLTNNIKVMRPTLYGYTATPEEWEHYSSQLMELLQSGEIKINISKIYPLKDYVQAITDLEGGKTTGKLLIEIK